MLINRTLRGIVKVHEIEPYGKGLNVWILTAGGLIKGELSGSLISILADNKQESPGDFGNIMKIVDEAIRKETSLPQNDKSTDLQDDFTLANIVLQPMNSTEEMKCSWAIIPFDAVLAWGFFPVQKTSA
jgi:hypothetical protein